MECGGGRGGCIKVTVEKQIFAPWPLGGAVGSLGGVLILLIYYIWNCRTSCDDFHSFPFHSSFQSKK